MSSDEQISIVMIGVTRKTAIESTQTLLAGTKYRVVACLDMTESPEQHRYSATNLGTVLHTLHPQPQVLITGTAVTADMCNEIEPVWRGYTNKLNAPCCWVALSKTHPTTGPPPDDIGDEIIKQLKAAFGE